MKAIQSIIGIFRRLKGSNHTFAQFANDAMKAIQSIIGSSRRFGRSYLAHSPIWANLAFVCFV